MTRQLAIRQLVAAALVSAGGLMAASSATAATIAPNTFGDDNTANGNCTLREAVRAANEDAAVDACTAGTGADQVQLAAGTYTLSVAGSAENAATTGDLDISDADGLTIKGDPAGSTVDASGIDRVFDVQANVAGTFERLTIRGGITPNVGGDDDGGGILVQGGGTANVIDATITRNTAQRAGGGIELDAGATANVTRSTLSENRANSDDGGGLDLDAAGATATVIDSTIAQNSAFDDGGGIESEDGATLNVTNSTISQNSVAGSGASPDGGGIRTFGAGSVTTVTSSTIAANSAAGIGGGLEQQNDGAVNVKGTIVAQNTAATGPDCDAATSQGNNLIQDTTGCTIAGQQASDITGQDPLLGQLDDNGGLTQTHALAADSPAIDAGPADAPPADQRGVARNPDIGAYELVTCLGVVVNRVGSEGDDTLTGTGGADGVLAFAGNDTVRTRAGDDAVCGGKGNDALFGGGADDSLAGGRGNDELNGGPGRNDVCNGGKGRRDTATRSCETVRGVP